MFNSEYTGRVCLWNDCLYLSDKNTVSQNETIFLEEGGSILLRNVDTDGMTTQKGYHESAVLREAPLLTAVDLHPLRRSNAGELDVSHSYTELLSNTLRRDSKGGSVCVCVS
jgi:hypothetical protein